MTEITENIAFIGIGAMGYGMASNIRQKISPQAKLYIYDVFQPTIDRFKTEFQSYGPIQAVQSPREAAESCSIIISIVPGADDVRQVYLDQSTGVIAAQLNPERLILECSTIDSKSSREVGQKLQSAGAGTYIDTPVSGGVPAAEAGSLTFLIGHKQPLEKDFLSLRLARVMSMMGDSKKFFYCGGLGAGMAAKISNNYLSCSIMLAVAEAMSIGIRSGIDPKLLHEVIHNSTGQSWMADNVQPAPGVVPHAPSSNNYRLGFKTQMMIKDLSLGVQAGHDTGINPTIAEAALRAFEKAAVDPQCIDRDGSSIYLHINQKKEDEEIASAL